MANPNYSEHALCAPELLALMNSSFTPIGTLLFPPVHIIFDNQGLSPVQISTDGGVTTWKTFPGGEALVLDMRGNHGLAANFAFHAGTVFSGKGASGIFSISYTYAKGTYS